MGATGKQKYSTVLTVETIEVLKRFAGHKQVAASTVIDETLRRCIPKRFYKAPYKAK